MKFLFIFGKSLKVLYGICVYSLGYTEEDIGNHLEVGFLDNCHSCNAGKLVFHRELCDF